jgi:hypothetical protein
MQVRFFYELREQSGSTDAARSWISTAAVPAVGVPITASAQAANGNSGSTGRVRDEFHGNSSGFVLSLAMHSIPLPRSEGSDISK